MRTLTDGYQFQQGPFFCVENDIIEIPYLRAEGINQPDKFYSARLQQMENGKYEISQLTEVLMTDFSMIESIPYFSFDTGFLELPLISSTDSKNQLLNYTGQLKYISTDTGKITFELLYAKKMQ